MRPGEASPITYSRGAMAGPTRKLGAILRDIRAGRFLPDETRSGRWRSSAGSRSTGLGQGLGVRGSRDALSAAGSSEAPVLPLGITPVDAERSLAATSASAAPPAKDAGVRFLMHAKSCVAHKAAACGLATACGKRRALFLPIASEAARSCSQRKSMKCS